MYVCTCTCIHTHIYVWYCGAMVNRSGIMWLCLHGRYYSHNNNKIVGAYVSVESLH